MPWANYHSHTHFCDGSHEPEAYALAAIEAGMPAYGFSGHGPLDYETKWNMKAADKSAYLDEISRLKKVYSDQIEIYTSIEADYLPGRVVPSDYTSWGLDYLIGSIHFTGKLPNGEDAEIDGSRSKFEETVRHSFGGSVKALMLEYYRLMAEMIDTQAIDVLGHMDRPRKHNEAPGELLFAEDESWYRESVDLVLQAARRNGTIIEVNTKEMYRHGRSEPYPAAWILEKILVMGIPVMLNADAHRPIDIQGEFEKTAALLHRIGFRELQVFLEGRWQSKTFGPEGIRF